ncbi:unnamed protein product [Dibothriocephalus latus]|uniref:Thioesterase domain-containing protein n=1 Tax=Dibothriocephalus latus TaxID=60516 RepID=A0A3P7MFN8_DIBLA|nr:unnamed protein product [Dibothriocephalus latus]
MRGGRLQHYIKAAKIDSWVIVESNIVKLGKILAFCEVSLFDEASGSLLAKGKHAKCMFS